MTPSDLTSIEQRMQQKWHDLVIAEQQGVSVQTLEHMYNAYIVAVEEYNRCLACASGMGQVAAQPVNKSQVYAPQQLPPVFSALPKAAPNMARKRKKAS